MTAYFQSTDACSKLTVGQVEEVLGEDAPVPVLLQRGQLNTDDLLLLGGQLLQHVLLQPPQQVRGQQLVQLGYLQDNEFASVALSEGVAEKLANSPHTLSASDFVKHLQREYLKLQSMLI